MNDRPAAGWDALNDPQYLQQLVLHVLRKHLRWFVLSALLGGLLAGLLSLFLPVKYSCVGTIQFSDKNQQTSSLARVMMGSSNNSLEDEILTASSREIGQQVIDELGLRVMVFDLQGPDSPLMRIKRRLGKASEIDRRKDYSRLVISDATVSENLTGKCKLLITADDQGNWTIGGMHGKNGEPAQFKYFSFTPTFKEGHHAGYRYRLIVLPDSVIWEKYSKWLNAAVATEKATSTLAVSFSYHNPVIAQQAAELVMDKYIQLSTQDKYGTIDASLGFVRSEVDKSRARIDTLSKECKEFQEKTDSVDVPAEVDVMLKSVADLVTRQVSQKSEVQRLDYLLSLLNKGSGADIGALASVDALAPDLSGSFSDLAGLQQRLDSLRQTKTALHPDVVAIQSQIKLVLGQTREKLRSLRHQAQLASSSLEGQINSYQSKLHTAPGFGIRIALINAEITGEQDILTAYRQQEALLMTQRASTDLELQILDRPFLPTKPSEPQVTRNAVYGAMLCFAAMCVILLQVEIRNKRFRSLRDLRIGAGMRVLAVMNGRTTLGNWKPGLYDANVASRLARYLTAGRSVLGIVHPAMADGGFDLAWSLCTALSSNGKRVLLIDADAVDESLCRACDAPSLTGLASLTGSEAELASATHNIDEHRAIAKLGDGAAGSEQIALIMNLLQERYPFIIVCLSSPLSWTPQTLAIAPSDLILSMPHRYCSLAEVVDIKAAVNEHGKTLDNVVVTQYAPRHDFLAKEELRFVTIK
jgi:uncharacterized protein involved in exopolysaccharide biosynthesis